MAEKLAPQGHVMVCTSRPAGIDEERFAGKLGTRWEFVHAHEPDTGRELVDPELSAALNKSMAMSIEDLEREPDADTLKRRQRLKDLAVAAAGSTALAFDDCV